METFAELLKDARYESLMTLQEASKRLGIDYSTLHGYENGTSTNPDYKLVVAVHELYHIPYKKLMGWRDRSDEADYEYLARSMQGTPDREQVAKIIDYMKRKAAEKAAGKKK